MRAERLSADRARALFLYDPDTGHLTWRTSRRGHVSAGDVAGTLTRSGYVQIKVDQQFHLAHRVAWLISFGHWPTEIDHINGRRTDNRLCNLRLCTKAENQANRPALKETRGVRLVPSKRWSARMTIAGKSFHLGTYDTKDEALRAYHNAMERRFGDFVTRGRFSSVAEMKHE